MQIDDEVIKVSTFSQLMVLQEDITLAVRSDTWRIHISEVSLHMFPRVIIAFYHKFNCRGEIFYPHFSIHLSAIRVI